MTDERAAALTRLLRVPGVRQVYPARRTPAALLQAAGELAGVAPPTVEASIGVDADRPALDTALKALAALRAGLPAGTRARIRIASVD